MSDLRDRLARAIDPMAFLLPVPRRRSKADGHPPPPLPGPGQGDEMKPIKAWAVVRENGIVVRGGYDHLAICTRRSDLLVWPDERVVSVLITELPTTTTTKKRKKKGRK